MRFQAAALRSSRFYDAWLLTTDPSLNHGAQEIAITFSVNPEWGERLPLNYSLVRIG